MAVVLIELPGGEGIVRGDDGEIALTHDVTLESGQPPQPWDRYQPIRLGLSDDRMLFGGLLPPEAVSVEAVEATGVRKAAAVDRRADAEEPCPVCGAVQYEEYFPTEQWRGGRGGMKGTDAFVPSPLVVCRVCGHQEEAGGILRYQRSEDPNEDDVAQAARLGRIRAEQAVQRWYSDKITLMAVRFPIYAAEGWPARINGSGSRGDDLTHLVIAHAETLPDSMFIQRPRTEITTDGVREPFLTVGSPNAHWVAVRRHHDVTITIAAREIDPASLIIEPIAGPNSCLLGPEREEP